MKYIVYETTNLINGKYYIGKHKIDNSNYLGSGIAILQAINKYGKENFMIEILREFNNEQDAYNFEYSIINNTIIKNNNCYNMIKGGCGYCSGENHPNYGKTIPDIVKQKIIKSTSGNNNHMYGKTTPEGVRKKQSMARIGKYKGKDHPNHKLWFLFGKLFYSSKKASECFNVSRAMIQRWCDIKSNYHTPLCYCVGR